MYAYIDTDDINAIIESVHANELERILLSMNTRFANFWLVLKELPQELITYLTGVSNIVPLNWPVLLPTW